MCVGESHPSHCQRYPISPWLVGQPLLGRITGVQDWAKIVMAAAQITAVMILRVCVMVVWFIG